MTDARNFPISQIAKIRSGLDCARYATFSFPDGRRCSLNIASSSADEALDVFLRNIESNQSLDCAIRETAHGFDGIRGLRTVTLTKLVDLIDVIEETAKASAPDPAIIVTLH